MNIYHPTTITQTEMRNINRSAIFDYLRLAGTSSRAEIAQKLKISLPSVTRIMDQLLQSGLVHSVGLEKSERGRSRELLEVNADDNLVIGIDLGGSHISGGLVNLGGEVLHEFHASTTHDRGEENYATLVSFLQSLLEQAEKQPARMLGIAIGVPGMLESRTGTVKLAPGLGWNDYPLLEKLERDIPASVILENDVNLATLGEQWFGAGQGVRDLVMVAIGTGIGAGIILDGKLNRGFAEASGEIGYFLPGVQFLNRQYPGFGALESVASGRGIVERATRRLVELGDSQKSSELHAVDVFQAAQEGKPWAVETIVETVDYLSLALANVTVCLDPELIILGGGVAGSAHMLIEPIKARLQGVIPRVPRIEESALKGRAAILGAVTRVVQKYVDYLVVYNS
ncbi:MAG: N-acetyl-D-glucosamine kinase [Anaerolineales bacterium]|nr:N-acetyl-D-glucosamine kinase [Anaerolineales bacterium]